MKSKRSKFVKVVHPDVEKPGSVPLEALAHWRSLGWELAPEEPAPAAEPASERYVLDARTNTMVEQEVAEPEWTPSADSEEEDTSIRSDA